MENDAFDDLRLYPNAILPHGGKSHVAPSTLTTFPKDDLIEPTHNELRSVFMQSGIALDDIGSRYYDTNPAFEWGRKLNP